MNQAAARYLTSGVCRRPLNRAGHLCPGAHFLRCVLGVVARRRRESASSSSHALPRSANPADELVDHSGLTLNLPQSTRRGHVDIGRLKIVATVGNGRSVGLHGTSPKLSYARRLAQLRRWFLGLAVTSFRRMGGLPLRTTTPSAAAASNEMPWWRRRSV